ncbi:MAG: hypothetical protein AB8B62_20005 [Roseobacter sp.]
MSVELFAIASSGLSLVALVLMIFARVSVGLAKSERGVDAHV